LACQIFPTKLGSIGNIADLKIESIKSGDEWTMRIALQNFCGSEDIIMGDC
jgi:hypothetical protein